MLKFLIEYLPDICEISVVSFVELVLLLHNFCSCVACCKAQVPFKSSLSRSRQRLLGTQRRKRSDVILVKTILLYLMLRSIVAHRGLWSEFPGEKLRLYGSLCLAQLASSLTVAGFATVVILESHGTLCVRQHPLKSLAIFSQAQSVRVLMVVDLSMKCVTVGVAV